MTLQIDKGRTVALVGPSGAGKTTLCHLIPRFYELNEGAITIDGIDIRRMSRYDLRRNIGMVAQDVFLFNGTIRQNIAYGKLDATDEEIIEAAKKANIHEYIMTMEQGYDTQVGERGVKLSGGQKQRISIARVFLKNPAILILDEATSALDNATEMLIQESLEELSRGKDLYCRGTSSVDDQKCGRDCRVDPGWCCGDGAHIMSSWRITLCMNPCISTNSAHNDRKYKRPGTVLRRCNSVPGLLYA